MPPRKPLARVPLASTSATSTPFKIKNKHRRSSHNVALRTSIAKAKRQARFDRRKAESKDPTLRRERLKQNVPQTLDSKRVAVDKPWIPSTELMERAKRKRDEMEGEESASDKEASDSNDEGIEGADEDEEMREDDSSENGSVGKEEASADDASDGGDDDNDLGSLIDSDSESESGTIPSKASKSTKATSKSKPTPIPETLSEETLATLLSLIPHPSAPPKLLLTTTRKARCHDQYQTLVTLLPNTTYVPRGNRFTIPQIASFATNRGYTHLIVGIEDSKKLHALVMILLPAGPTFHFSLTSWADGKAIRGRGVNTHHIPELILNNFTTPIGRLAASLFQSLYPPQPQFQGRQVVTLHNQRDYIFFRMHRYVFRSVDPSNSTKNRGDRTTGAEHVGVGGQRAGEDLGVRVGLQELGPQFTLKLRRVERGVCEGVEWEWKGRMEKDRKMFHL
ncbi:hypothetical protein ABW19_dt0200598 [Dactylella cylindrospora]|nr:hypothetical protein ABW19_dt0200598 [Dactylella cylindrospora]